MLKTCFNWSRERFIFLLSAVWLAVNIAGRGLGKETFFVCLGALEPCGVFIGWTSRSVDS